MTAAIVVEGLVKRFGSVEALAGIDFEVPEGTIFGLLGPNGAGKTTAVRILATIAAADAGRAQVLGYDVARNPKQVRHLIGLAGQSAAVDPNLTGRENLRLIGALAQLPKKLTRSRADELLTRFDLLAAGDRPIRTYSGGMRRRLDVAAALVGRPPVIFLDEPTTGLDIQSRTELWSVIRELVAEGSTVLLTTQYLEEADQLAGRIAVINAGKVVANDTATNLKSALGASVIEVSLASAEQAVRAQTLLAPLVDTRPELEGTKVRLSTADAPAALTKVLRVLDANGMHAAGIGVREPSLDDVFLSLTGSNAGQKPAEPAAISPPPRPAEPGTGWQKELNGYEDLQGSLNRLAYQAGEGTVIDNLVPVVRQAHSQPFDKIDLGPLAGYLRLEQRFGRISPGVSAEQAAAVLIGAAVAGGPEFTRDLRPDAGPGDFAQNVVRILLEGIAPDAPVRR